MAMPALLDPYWTAAAVRALPEDGKRYECIDGELLVTPAPRLLHQRAVAELGSVLRDFVGAQGVGELFQSPADIELEAGTLVQPDLFVAVARDGTRLREWTDVGSLRLVVEVISRSTARQDRVIKREFYQRAGVAEYWIVDLDARLIERWRGGESAPTMLSESLQWAPHGSSAPLRLDLPALFAAICD
jgi:Uma2 family endonuclease